MSVVWCIEDHFACPSRTNETVAAKHAQMVTHIRFAHAEHRCKITHAEFPGGNDPRHEPAAAGIREDLEQGSHLSDDFRGVELQLHRPHPILIGRGDVTSVWNTLVACLAQFITHCGIF